ncbi:uncharacterized protein F4807DRAFT_462452 [Annulohypoxylon truncatum]|uniref:uncharacterized protein n=1 Tax=Annulohypoxylon truncatum TaxID=327061 RepID=UPI0020086457|nr:uncharacterized protein F4807DRAFT_462452 [Annulohypoxylon truncatum]KAI1207646.1 hypothetical protein F4807DRAFT_462452 [Annulohypoxylon truncatum]
MAQHTNQDNDWGIIHVRKLELMLDRLHLEGVSFNGPHEVLDPMDIDAGPDVDIEQQTGSASIVSDSEPMEMDQESDTCTDGTISRRLGCNALAFRRRYDDQKSNKSFSSHVKRRPIHRVESQSKGKVVYKERLARVTPISKRLVGYDPIRTFAENCEKTLSDWVILLRKTTLPNGIVSEDPRIISAFKAVDSVICGQGTNMLRRLANVQLMRLFRLLEDIIKSDRDNGHVHREPYYRDANVAMDIYMSSQETQSNMKELRLKLKQGRKRFSKRWSDLAAPSPLFVLIYSDAAEAIVKDFKRVDNATLHMVATSILSICPSQLVSICAHLAEASEAAARSNNFIGMLPFTAANIRQILTA